MRRSMDKKHILCVCGASCASGVAIGESVKELCKDVGIPIEVTIARASEVRGRVESLKPDLIVHTASVPNDLGVPTLRGIPFLTGIGVDELKEEILKILSK